LLGDCAPSISHYFNTTRYNNAYDPFGVWDAYITNTGRESLRRVTLQLDTCDLLVQWWELVLSPLGMAFFIHTNLNFLISKQEVKMLFFFFSNLYLMARKLIFTDIGYFELPAERDAEGIQPYLAHSFRYMVRDNQTALSFSVLGYSCQSPYNPGTPSSSPSSRFLLPYSHLLFYPHLL
jgi:hypothetical protein